MRSHARDIIEQFVQAGACEIVDVRSEVCLIQLRGAAERRSTRMTRLFGKSENPEDQGKIGEGRDFRVVDIMHWLRSMPARVIQAQDRLELGSRLRTHPEMHGRDSGQAVACKANYRIRQALR